MAVTWGPAVNTSTNGMRVGIDLSVSTSGATATVTLDLWLWTKRASFGSSSSYSRGGTFGSGSGTFSHNHSNNSSDWPTSNRTRIGRWTTTRTMQYGQTQSVSASGSVSGVSAVPGTASHSRSVTIPARRINAPTPPTGAFVYPQSSYTRARLEWTNNGTTAAPWQSIHVERRHIQADGSFSAWARRANLSGSASSYTDSVNANWHYHYRVRANNTSGNSAWLDMGRLNTTPGQQQDVRARASSSGITVTWRNNVRIPASQVRTEVQHSADGGAWATVADLSGRPVSWAHTGPDMTKTHRYRVRVIATEWGSATGNWSAASNTVELAAPPSAPTGLGPAGAWDATEDHTLTWRHVPTDGADQERFELRHRVKGGSWVTVAPVDSDTSAWTLPGGTYSNGETVEWQVRTWGPHPDPGPWSATAVTVPSARPTVSINAPEDGAVVDRSALTVTWGYDHPSGGSQAGWRYSLERDGQVVQSRSGSGSGSNQRLTGLVDGATYVLRVAVRGGSGLWSHDEVATFSVAYVPPQAPGVEVAWDVDLGAAVVTISQPVWDQDSAEPDYHQVWRAIDDGPWLLIADEVPLGTSVTDPIPAIGDGTVNHYRATTVSVLPSTAESGTVPLAVSTRMTLGWVYLNAGGSMSEVCRVRANARRSDTAGLAKTLRQFAGRVSPVEYAGTARSMTWDVSARIAPNHDGASTRAELLAMQAMPAPVCYRDPAPEAPARWFASMGPVSSSWQSILGEVSWSMTEVDHVEGLDVEARDGGGS